MLVSTLRQRILGTLATSTLFTVACSGQTTPTTTSTASGPPSVSSAPGSSSGKTAEDASSSAPAPAASCVDGRKERTCFAPESILTKNSGYGGRPDRDAAPPPPPTRDANGCVVLEEVMNGCCNEAISGPTLEDGKCCYEFCAGSCCGRPLVIDGRARVAEPATRWDWAFAHARAEVVGPTRAALREAWTRDALLEHASIASFATFTLELLALGAPPDLVRGAQAAIADEIDHARLTFAIASSHADAPLGPSALDVGGVAPQTSLAAVAAACVRDGCVNETIASAIAGAQAKNAVDPELRATLERIAEDESRHAELGWRFVQWALSLGKADVREAVRAAFEAPVAEAPSIPEGVDVAVWRANGRLLPSEHTSVVRSVMEQVIAPCRDLLMFCSASPAMDDRRATTSARS